VWYSSFTKSALRKHNLRVDLRVYVSTEEEFPTKEELSPRVKSLLSSAIIKGLDIICVVSKFGIQIGNFAKQTAQASNIDVKILSGQDYLSLDNVKAVFINGTKNVPPGLPIKKAITIAKKHGAKILFYDLSKNLARTLDSWQSTPYEPDIVEIYNAQTKAYKDLDIDFPRVISSAAKSGTELETTPLYTEMSRRRLEDFGFLAKDEGVEYTPDYLKGTQSG
jgi:hypothetical protein